MWMSDERGFFTSCPHSLIMLRYFPEEEHSHSSLQDSHSSLKPSRRNEAVYCTSVICMQCTCPAELHAAAVGQDCQIGAFRQMTTANPSAAGSCHCYQDQRHGHLCSGSHPYSSPGRQADRVSVLGQNSERHFLWGSGAFAACTGPSSMLTHLCH